LLGFKVYARENFGSHIKALLGFSKTRGSKQ
jgi:hypothetical protein